MWAPLVGGHLGSVDFKGEGAFGVECASEEEEEWVQVGVLWTLSVFMSSGFDLLC